MTDIRITIRLTTTRNPEQVREFMIRSAAQAGEVKEAQLSLLDTTTWTNADRVRHFLQDNPHKYTQAQIARAMRVNPTAVSRALRKLRHEVSVEGRKYFIPQ